MPRRFAAVAATAVTGLAIMAGPAAAAPATVVGTVGPAYSISLTKGGKKVTRLKAGVRYRFVIRDRSSDHDFRLVGPRTSKLLSGEEFTGTKATVLTLRKGAYRFYCAPHSDGMRGGFTVS